MNDTIKPNKKLSGVCGVFCESCTVYIGTKEEPARVKQLAGQLKCRPEDMECHGCRSDTLSLHCRTCNYRSCAESKNVDFCVECPEYPCDEIKDFQKQMPHRADLFEDNDIIKKDGYETWYKKMIDDNLCHECGTINSAYDLVCRKCSASPASDFVRKHKDIIEVHVKRMMGN